jgi:hypothetical protein
MDLLLDHGFPRTTAILLWAAGVRAAHVGEIGLATADDAEILAKINGTQAIFITLDNDFSAAFESGELPIPTVMHIGYSSFFQEMRPSDLAQAVLDGVESWRSNSPQIGMSG